MKFGIQYSSAFHGVDPANIMAYAKHAEDCAFESFYLPEHVVLYPGATLGPMAIDPSLSIVDPLEALAFVAAATIDALSKGRMRLLTVGLGATRRKRHGFAIANDSQ